MDGRIFKALIVSFALAGLSCSIMAMDHEKALENCRGKIADALTDEFTLSTRRAENVRGRGAEKAAENAMERCWVFWDLIARVYAAGSLDELQKLITGAEIPFSCPDFDIKQSCLLLINGCVFGGGEVEQTSDWQECIEDGNASGEKVLYRAACKLVLQLTAEDLKDLTTAMRIALVDEKPDREHALQRLVTYVLVLERILLSFGASKDLVAEMLGKLESIMCGSGYKISQGPAAEARRCLEDKLDMQLIEYTIEEIRFIKNKHMLSWKSVPREQRAGDVDFQQAQGFFKVCVKVERIMSAVLSLLQ